MMRRGNKDNMEYYEKPIIVITVIVAVLSACFITIYNKDRLKKYEQAVTISESSNLEKFLRVNDDQYAFIENTTISAKNPVTHEELDGEYIIIKEEEQEYETSTDSDGNTSSSWETKHTSTWKTDYIKVLEQEISYEKFRKLKPSRLKIKKVPGWSDRRYIYKGIHDNIEGTVFLELKDGVLKSADFYENMNIKQVKAETENSKLVYIILIAAVIVIIIIKIYCYTIITISN